MHRIDVAENNGNYVVCFGIPGAQEPNILLRAEAKSVNVVVVRDITKLKLDAERDPEFDDNLMYDLTAGPEGEADMDKFTWSHFGGLLEVAVPKQRTSA